jgi:fucose 4-O-acetylase-like acetyltransferase
MRNTAIDIEKGLGIILVAVGHNWVIVQKNEELFRIIYSFHVPLFFFLSGVLFRSDIKFFDMLSQKFHSILKPYFVVLLGVAIYAGISSRMFPFDNLIGIIFATGQSILWIPMWFLPNLFISVLFSWWLISFFELSQGKLTSYLTIFSLLIIGICVINESRSLSLGSLILIGDRTRNLIGLPFSIDLIFISAAYFIFGKITSDSVKNYKFDLSYLIFALILFTSCHYFFNESMDLNSRIYGNPILSSLQAISGIYLIVVLSESVKNIKAIAVVLSYIGSGSIFVLIFHGILQAKAISKYQSIFPNSGLIGGLFGLLAGIACSLLIWEIVKRVPIASAFLLPRRQEVVTKT